MAPHLSTIKSDVVAHLGVARFVMLWHVEWDATLSEDEMNHLSQPERPLQEPAAERGMTADEAMAMAGYSRVRRALVDAIAEFRLLDDPAIFLPYNATWAVSTADIIGALWEQIEGIDSTVDDIATFRQRGE
jgi:hypothetical protein